HPVSRPAGIGRNRVYVVDDERGIHALDFEGRILWRKTLEETVAGPLNEFGERLYAGTEEGSLIALRADDGSEVWRFRAGQAVRTGALVWRNRRGTPFLLCGGDAGKIYFLDPGGRRSAEMECGSPITLPPLLDGDRLYAAVRADGLLCLNLEKRSLAWRVRLAGTPAKRFVADARRLFFLTAQGVLVCLDKKSGSLLWWKTMSSRTAFDPVLAGGQVLAAALSDRLAGFRARDGKETGLFQIDGEFRANPVWVEPRVLCHASDNQKEGEALLVLRRQVPVALNASKPSPVRVGEEVVFTASHAGFKTPRFEFILKSAAGERVVQTASDRETWTWRPEAEGAYKIQVRVTEGERTEESTLEIRVVR
ncbi:MAG: PQQ-binding-like beta-propeller repeat protein, partial [Candidatus Aminicenantes bacterium]|nr:PQQ-binding-like beta-propeller repeat protein [Candidatus Aminicenantes bacterium]